MSSASCKIGDLDLLQLEADFLEATNLSPRRNVDASKLTTFRIGGAFQFYIEPQTIQTVCQSVRWCNKNKQKLYILGAGSNLLVNSNGILGWTLHLGRPFKGLEKLNNNTFRVGAGYSLATLARELSLAGFSGLEFAAGIPGSIGGAVRMNAGAHHSEISSVLSALEAVDSDGEPVRFTIEDLNFDYRKCSLPPDFLITAAEFRLTPSKSSKVMENLTRNLEYRKKTQPLSQPSAGSVFRNPRSSPESSAGAIIERLGLKGRAHAGAQISDKHANWIINPKKNATSLDVVALIELCKSEAQKQLAEELRPEIVMW